MTKPRRTISLGLSAQEFPEGQHICYIFNDDEERFEVMAKYLQSGHAAKEKLLYLVDSMTNEEMLDHLKNQGVDFSDTKPGEFTLADAAPAYCPSGFFKTEEMLDIVRDFYLGALDEGYTGARGTGEMSWCLTEGRANHLELMDYESRLNTLLEKYPYTAC
ncbi:MAG TPA: MEDS domain-containing protein [Geopsychrobacteraceae bacterium]|nr:MEDS domain-containing protein [Geopsychrobacteraceae bacterium]